MTTCIIPDEVVVTLLREDVQEQFDTAQYIVPLNQDNIQKTTDMGQDGMA